jgi:hypothetical protein
MQPVVVSIDTKTLIVYGAEMLFSFAIAIHRRRPLTVDAWFERKEWPEKSGYGESWLK